MALNRQASSYPLSKSGIVKAISKVVPFKSNDAGRRIWHIHKPQLTHSQPELSD